MVSRRDFIKGAMQAGLVVAAGVTSLSRFALGAIPEAISVDNPKTQKPPTPQGQGYHPVVTLNGWSLPWRMNKGWKEFHLCAEPVKREMAPGMIANLWGYNGQSPGPTIEVIEGDKVRIFVTNRLPEETTVHWHGQRLPNGMDGVAGLTQRPIQPGKTYVYEFEARRAGTFMYHPHADEMVQMAMGMMGFWITHPKDPNWMKVDRDFCFLLNSYDIDPGSYTPNINTMVEFNLWTFNSRVYPGIDPLVCRLGDKVRIRVGNLSMTSHPIHLHGHEFVVAGTDGGWIPPEARWPEVTTNIAVGQMRAIEFVASEPGDWAFHCHKAHHTMNAMGHDVPTMIGVDAPNIANKIAKLIPGFMAMGESGMADMGEMHMPLPENTLPMMMGKGPFGAIGMGGMFTVLKTRENQPPGDYRDPGWYKQPPGTAAYEYEGPVKEAPQVTKATKTQCPHHGHHEHHHGVELNVQKPKGHHHHHG